MSKKICAIYTRKSTDERLDMEFNTLDAQREACESYILSQRSEGWRASQDYYDDGGYSGGSLDRPALTRMIEDIKSGKINIVVVYKIDRLTRSLADFSKLVDVFDDYGVTFVSVTQSFNTTTSMGRLTLNVLLSFAQFEREVSGERIRDKIAASKRKGMWMGGMAPIGYKIENRRLSIHKKEARLVQKIFDYYQEVGAVKALKQKLDDEKIKTPKRKTLKGKSYGGKHFSRGALYALLKNPVYIGQIVHKDITHDGLHDGIIDEEQWREVQKILHDKNHQRQKQTKQRYMLQGLIFDNDDTIYSPTYTKKKDVLYRYYISQNLLQYKDHPKGIMARVPATEIEQFILKHLRQQIDTIIQGEEPLARDYILKHKSEISDTDLINTILQKIVVGQHELTLFLKVGTFIAFINERFELSVTVQDDYSVSLPFRLSKTNNGAVTIEQPVLKKPKLHQQSDSELEELVKGIVWRERHFDGKPIMTIAKEENVSDFYISKLIYKSFETLINYQ